MDKDARAVWNLFVVIMALILLDPVVEVYCMIEDVREKVKR